MDCLIIRPPFEHTGFDQDTQESLGIAYLLAALRERGFSASLLDGELQDLTAQQIASAVNTLKPAVAGFSIMAQYAIQSACEIADMIKSGPVHLTAGGYLPSFFPEEIFRSIPGLDSIVQFEGEKILADLVENTLKSRAMFTPGITLRAEDGGVNRSEPESTPDDLNILPMPHRDALPRVLKMGMPVALSSSRGCSGACTFCSIKKFCINSCGIPLRQRSAENIIEEILFLRRVHGVKIFHFTDDDFIGNRETGFARALKLANMMKKECPGMVFRFECRPDLVDPELFSSLKEAGLAGVFLGIDSSIEKTRSLYNKNCPMETVDEAVEIIRSLELDLDTGFIPFHPDVSFDEILSEHQFLFSRNLDNMHTLLNRLYCTGESPLSQMLLKQGRLRKDGEFELSYDFKDSRVSLLHETASVAMKPFFPAWYDIYKQRRLACDLFLAGTVDSGELARKDHALNSANAAVRNAIKEISEYASSDSNADLLEFTRTVRLRLKSEIAPPGETQ